MTYGTLLVETVLFDEDTTLTSTKPTQVFSVETVQLLGQVNPCLCRAAASAISSEYHHPTHYVVEAAGI
jgi:hypothetical protein